jgi:L-Ala-D/L-Glu epimerase
MESTRTRAAARRTLDVRVEKWPLRAPFRITGHTFHDLEVVVVTLEQDGLTGRGEAAGVYYRNDGVDHMRQQIESVRTAIEGGLDREALQRALPAGGARNALDCALWELEAKRAGRAVWQLAGLAAPTPRVTTYTLSADEPAQMASRAAAFADATALKLKLTGEPSDLARICAVRTLRPDVWLGVDANQGYTRAALARLMPALTDARVELIEQPFAVGQEAELDGFDSPIPIAADESVQVVGDLAALAGRFDVVNIKLDKCGGLTAALAMAQEARRLGFETMVGNMVGTALAMAPAFLVAQQCKIVDLDGPLFLRADRTPGVRYEAGTVWCSEEIWGGLSSRPHRHRA